jgi:esterase/lipase superfamily enzyme
MLRLQFQDDHLKVRECRILGGDAFWLSITEHLREWPEPERMALAFIHGYNVDFKESVIRAAQIGFDLKVPLTALFSWPSKGATTAYPTDEASIEASEPFIQSFLEGLAATPGVGRVHVIAHSMGNRGVLRALERIASKAATRSKPPFGQIILAAPDVDRDAFFQLASAHQALVQGTTLYACSRDKALLMSQRIRRGYPRAGYLPPLTLLSGVDTIDASDVDLDLLGHGYVAQAEPVLRDIHTIFKDYKRPDDRFGLIRDIEDGLPFWKISGAYRSLINP